MKDGLLFVHVSGQVRPNAYLSWSFAAKVTQSADAARTSGPATGPKGLRRAYSHTPQATMKTEAPCTISET